MLCYRRRMLWPLVPILLNQIVGTSGWLVLTRVPPFAAPGRGRWQLSSFSSRVSNATPQATICAALLASVSYEGQRHEQAENDISSWGRNVEESHHRNEAGTIFVSLEDRRSDCPTRLAKPGALALECSTLILAFASCSEHVLFCRNSH